MNSIFLSTKKLRNQSEISSNRVYSIVSLFKASLFEIPIFEESVLEVPVFEVLIPNTD